MNNQQVKFGSAGYVGAVGGTADGFVPGVGNAWMNGASFGVGLQAGYTGAGMGLIGGGIGGGISGGFGYVNEQIAFRHWLTDNGLQAGASITANDRNLNSFTDYWYRTHYSDAFKTVDTWTHDNLSKEASRYFAENPLRAGYTDGKIVNGIYTGRSSVYFSDASFTSARQLYFPCPSGYIHP